MDGEYSPSSGIGCIWWIGLGAFLVILVMASGTSGKSGTGGTNPTNATNSRAGTLSGNQVDVLSKNQLNLWSDVTNCYGDYSCMTIVTTTTSTVQNTSTDVRTNTTVNGDRNVVIGSDGAQLCEGDDGIFRLCEGQ